ncbi:MAG TPA: glycerophosphodiester phosphodiesterase family protein [Candidatus Saccharimonadales bacterium]|jgi:glycerophosphoryl diester phosphodiesterase
MTKNNTTKIVGHRGAAGLQPENTLPGFLLAKRLGVDAIELDVRLTRDNQFVVCHNDRVRLSNGTHGRVSKQTYGELTVSLLSNGHRLLLLQEVLAAVPNIPIVLDLKIDHGISELSRLLETYDNEFTFVTHRNRVVRECKRLRPDIPAFVGRHYSPVGLMRSIRIHDADGINLNYIWLNPLTYYAAQKLGLQIQVYTVNNVTVARLLQRFYPGIWICTDRPDLLIRSLRSKPIYSVE